jgi:hypothetical protein
MWPDAVPVPLAEKPKLWAMFQCYAEELAFYANLTPMDGIVSYPALDLDAMQVAKFYILPAHRGGKNRHSFARGCSRAFFAVGRSARFWRTKAQLPSGAVLPNLMAIQKRHPHTKASSESSRRSRSVPRGDIPIDVFWQTAKLPNSAWLPDTGVSPYRGRG